MPDLQFNQDRQKEVLEASFTSLEEELNVPNLSKEQIDLKFGTLINTVLQPVEDFIEQQGEDVTVEEVNKFLGETAKEGIPLALNFIKGIAEEYGIADVTLQTWFGPQSVGKGALGDTVQWLYQIFTLPEGEIIGYLEKTLKKYELSEQKFSELSTMLQLVSRELDPTLKAIFPLLISSNSDTIKIGTGGIFRPLGVEKPEPRYLPYVKQEKATKILTDVGTMLHPEWTNFLATIEFGRSLAYKATMIDADVWPRTDDQVKYLNERFIPALKGTLEIRHVPLHIEPFTEEIAELIEKNPEQGLAAYEYVGNMIRDMVKYAEQHNIDPNDLDIFKKLGINPKDKVQVAENMTQIKEVGSQTSRGIAGKVGGILRNQLNTANAIVKQIVTGMSEGIETLMVRVSNRIRTQGRADDLKIGIYLNRLGTYYAETGVAPIKMGSKILPAGGSYENAIEAQLKALALRINPDYNFDNKVYREFEKLVRELYLIRVSK